MARAQPGAEDEGLGAPALPVVQGQGGLQQALGGGVLACQHQYPFGGFPGAGAEGQDAAAAQTLPFQRGEQAGQFRSREDAAEQAVMAQQAPGRMAEHGQRIRHAWLFPGPPGSGRPGVQGAGAAQGGITPGTGRVTAAVRQRIGRVGQDEMEGIFAAVPQKMRIGKVALPKAAYGIQPQKAGIGCGRSAQGRVLLQAQSMQAESIVLSAAFSPRLTANSRGLWLCTPHTRARAGRRSRLTAMSRHLRRSGRQAQAQAQQGRTAAAAQLRHLSGGRSRQGGEVFRREGRQQQGIRTEAVAVLRLVQAPGKEGAGGGDGGIVHGLRWCWRFACAGEGTLRCGRWLPFVAP